MKRKNYLYLVLALVLTLASCGNKALKEKVVGSYENGKPFKVYFYDSEDRWVREAEYYESGQVKMEGSIENNLRNGDWTAYFPDGKVQSTGVFIDGVCTGKKQIFYENGHLWMDGWYKDNNKCGEWIFYDEQGYETKRINYGSCD